MPRKRRDDLILGRELVEGLNKYRMSRTLAMARTSYDRRGNPAREIRVMTNVNVKGVAFVDPASGIIMAHGA